MNGAAAAEHSVLIRKVLVVCSGSDSDANLLASASDLAELNGASLVVLSVVEMPPDARELARAANIDIDVALKRLLDERRAEILSRAKQAVPEHVPPVQVRVGKPFLEIIRHVIDENFDFVVKTAEPLLGAKRFLFASTDQHLLRKCPCSVWLRQPDTPRRVTNVIAAVDVDLDDAIEPETLGLLNKSVMETAARLSPISDTTISALHAWDAPGEGLVRLWTSGPDAGAAAEAYIATIHANRAKEIQSLALDVTNVLDRAGFGNPGYRTILERGTARAVIAEQTRALHADVLVIGTVARTGLQGVIIGNTAEDVLNSIDCSVVAVKPPGFVTPLDFSRSHP